jgi:hypothetical protein
MADISDIRTVIGVIAVVAVTCIMLVGLRRMGEWYGFVDKGITMKELLFGGGFNSRLLRWAKSGICGGYNRCNCISVCQLDGFGHWTDDASNNDLTMHICLLM